MSELEREPTAGGWDRMSQSRAHMWASPKATPVLGSSTVTRVKEEAEIDPTFKPRSAGFTARIEPVELEPKLWDGDDA